MQPDRDPEVQLELDWDPVDADEPDDDLTFGEWVATLPCYPGATETVGERRAA